MSYRTMQFLFQYKRWLRIISYLLAGYLPLSVDAQNSGVDSPFARASLSLDSITVTAFRNNYIRAQLPASIVLLTPKEISGMGSLSPLPVFNQMPGVKMEERSPGSYRLSIRGSLLRSPFGVRNVKMYLNQIPLTDAGGNTYLNLIPVGMLQTIEIIKGPASSVYGAGTGGVILLQSGAGLVQENSRNTFTASLIGGSYGLTKQSFGWLHVRDKTQFELFQDRQQASGYRQQSAMHRDAISARLTKMLKQHRLSLQALYADLFYQTPGGLTLSQFLQNPSLARPATTTLPGAIQQNTSVSNQTLWVSLSHEWKLHSKWQIHSFISNLQTRFENPFITNYEKRSEHNWGAGTNIRYATQWTKTRLEWVSGIEWLQQQSRIQNFGNRNGKQDTLQFTDQLRVSQWYVYSQLTLRVARWIMELGISSNQQPFTFQRVSDPLSLQTSRIVPSIPAPRISITRSLGRGNIYLLASRGFSPPTLAEIRPSDGNYYGQLAPESGWNLEAGWRISSANQRWQWEASFYRFALNQAIVRRNNASGAEYFINAGSTLQQGIETRLQWKVLSNKQPRRWEINWQGGCTYQPYYFVQYRQGNVDYSGNPITGIPPTILFTGLQYHHQKGWYATTQLTANAALPLNDLSDEYAKAYQLLQAEIGYKFTHRQLKWQLFVGADNILNQSYSLGNDINAAGRRYYNAAPAINGFAGIRLISR